MVSYRVLAFALLGYRLGSLHGSLMAHLRDRHRDAWQHLGSPHTAWAGWTPLTLFYFAFGRYEGLGDSSFSAAARRFRAGLLLWTFGSIAVAAVFWYWFPLLGTTQTI